MQKQFVICLLSKEGRHVNVEVKQKSSHINKRKVKTWSNEEDALLLQLYQQYPKKWTQIAALMKDRNENQCLHRYRRLSQLGKNHKIWSSQEDQTVRKLIKKYGKNWKLLSELMGSKNGKQIRQRFINKLDPHIKKEQWSQEEDRTILELYSKIGSRWSEISKFLVGRPQNKIKNRFYSFIQKNYDIRFKEVESFDQMRKKAEGEQKKEEYSIANNKQNQLQQYPQHLASLIDVKLDHKHSEERILSRFQIPSINEIEFDLRNEQLMSQNMLEPVLREEEWRSNKDYQSIIELNSDLYFKYHI